MKVKRCVKESFVVIGKEGSTLDGDGFIQKLWEDANGAFCEIQHLAKKDEQGHIVGIWELCLISPIHLNPGKRIILKGYTLREQNVMMTPLHQRGGRNGTFLAMSIYMWNVLVMIHFLR